MDTEENQYEDVDKKKLEKVRKFITDKDLAMYEEVSELKEKLEEIAESLERIADKEMPEMPHMEMPEVQKMEVMGAEVITIKGEKGDTGEKGEQGEKGLDGKDGKNGKDGKDGLNGADGLDGRDGVDGKNGENGKDGSPDTPEQIKEKLETLEGDNRIDASAIKNLDEKIDKKVASVPRVGGAISASAVRQAFKYIFHTEEPTGAINGVNTTYTVSNPIWAIIGFTLNGESIAELPNYTFSGRTITFSSALPAAYSGKDWEIKYIG